MSDLFPPPHRDRDSEAWWTGLRDGRLLLQRCRSCRQVRSPRLPACPYCGGPDSEDHVASGRGRVYSWIRVHRDLRGAGAAVPYVVAAVDLDDGGRVFARVVESEDAVAIGAPVGPRFVGHGSWTELAMAVVEPSAAEGSVE